MNNLFRKKDKPLEPKTTDDNDLSDDRYKLTNDGKRYKLFDILDDERMICYASNVFGVMLLIVVLENLTIITLQ